MFGQLFLPNQVTRFVILFLERDGSTYLTSLLMSHPNVKAVFERFAVMRNKGKNGKEQLAWMRRFMQPAIINRHGAIGFKTKLGDILAPDEFTDLAAELQCRVIHMRRWNHVKAVVSKVNARRLYEKSGNWNLYDMNDRMPPLAIEPSEFDRMLFERATAESQLTEFIETLGQPTLQVGYEEILADREAVLKSVFNFLGVPDKPVKSKTIKHTSDNLRDVLTNFAELRSHYEGTDYAPMFDKQVRPAA